MIKKCCNQWCLYTKDGSRLLGKHPSRASAMKQESAINISKAKKAGHIIPKK
jgi:hypothetical protein